MRQYPVPFQRDDEERTIGGVFSVRQLVCVVVGVAGGGGLAAITPLPLWGRIAVAIPLAVAGIAFAFLRIKGMHLGLYLWRWMRWKRQGEAWFYRRSCDEDGE